MLYFILNEGIKDDAAILLDVVIHEFIDGSYECSKGQAGFISDKDRWTLMSLGKTVPCQGFNKDRDQVAVRLCMKLSLEVSCFFFLLVGVGASKMKNKINFKKENGLT